MTNKEIFIKQGEKILSDMKIFKKKISDWCDTIGPIATDETLIDSPEIKYLISRIEEESNEIQNLLG